MATERNTSKPILQRIALTTIITSLALGAASTALADDSKWQHFSDGEGTAFEERWAAVSFIESASAGSADGMYLGVNTVGEGKLKMYVTLQVLLFSNCTATDWAVAIDQTRYSVTSYPSENEDAVFLEPSSEDYKAFWSDFVAGNRIAVRFTSECASIFSKDTTEILEKILVFPLSGSRAVVEHVLGDESGG